MTSRIRQSACLAALAAVVALPAHGQAPVSDPQQMNARITRIERALSGSSVLQMHQTLQNLEREVRELRGEIEVKNHAIEQLKQRQRDLYLDMDRRLQALEATAAATPPLTAATPPVPGTAPVLPAQPATGTQAPQPVTTPPIASVTPAPSGTTPGTTPGATAAGTTTPPTTPPAPTTPAANVDPAAEQQAYRSAFELLKSGQFTQASAALSTFLTDYPNGRFADNAQYWLGESYYVSREFDPALKAFDRLLADFPDSPKRSHAMLKIGFIHDEQGRKEDAKKVLGELTQLYPQSTAASLAAKRLKRLQTP